MLLRMLALASGLTALSSRYVSSMALVGEEDNAKALCSEASGAAVQPPGSTRSYLQRELDCRLPALLPLTDTHMERPCGVVCAHRTIGGGDVMPRAATSPALLPPLHANSSGLAC